VESLRALTPKPLAVGFGISTPGHVREAAAIADGIIVGSALIDAYAGKDRANAADAVREWIAPLVEAARR
jgi:tryptophan synthase alpha chain